MLLPGQKTGSAEKGGTRAGRRWKNNRIFEKGHVKTLTENTFSTKNEFYRGVFLSRPKFKVEFQATKNRRGKIKSLRKPRMRRLKPRWTTRRRIRKRSFFKSYFSEKQTNTILA